MEKKHQQEEYVDFVVTARKYKTLLTAKYKSRHHKVYIFFLLVTWFLIFPERLSRLW